MNDADQNLEESPSAYVARQLNELAWAIGPAPWTEAQEIEWEMGAEVILKSFPEIH